MSDRSPKYSSKRSNDQPTPDASVRIMIRRRPEGESCAEADQASERCLAAVAVAAIGEGIWTVRIGRPRPEARRTARELRLRDLDVESFSTG